MKIFPSPEDAAVLSECGSRAATDADGIEFIVAGALADTSRLDSDDAVLVRQPANLG
jgi:hypothetical protein